MKKYSRLIPALVALFVLLSSAEVAFADGDVVSTYIADLHARAEHITDTTARAEVNSFIGALEQCLGEDLTDHAGQKNWQFTPNSTPITTVDGLRNSINDSHHPCGGTRDQLTDALERALPAASPSNPDQPTTNNNNQTTTGGGPAADNSAPTTNQPVQNEDTPIYQRITPPSNHDVLTPALATSNPTIGGLVNYLFDLFVRRLLPWLVALMVVLLVWAGYNYILANGDSGKIKQAKDMVLYTIIAIIIAFSALSIISIMNNIIIALH